MGLLWVVSIGLLAVIARTQDIRNCSVEPTSLTIGSTEDVGTLATSLLGCPKGDFNVQWVGEVFVEEAIRVTGGASLDITGAGPGAIVDGGSKTQLFYVDEGSTLHLTDVTLANGHAPTGGGGAIFVNGSTVSFSGSISVISNSAGEDGDDSTVSWDGDSTEFSNNFAVGDGGAIYADNSTVSWGGDGTQFSHNYGGAEGQSFPKGNGGAVFASRSTVSWDGDNTRFSNNYAGAGGQSFPKGGAIYAGAGSTVSWDGDSTQFSNNSATKGGGGFGGGGAISAYGNSIVSWDGDITLFIHNSAADGGAISTFDSTVSWDGDGTLFSNNSADADGGAIYAFRHTVSWSGDGTQFNSNSAGNDGGAVHVSVDASVSWDGDSTQFSDNSAGDGGGAISVDVDSTLSWNGDDTLFASNLAQYSAGAIYVTSNSTLSWDVNGTLFSNNSAGESGGAIHGDHSKVSWDGSGTLFISNSAGLNGGAVCGDGSMVSWNGDRTIFSNNSAGENGGAIHAYSSTVSWYGDGTVFFSNSAGLRGGATFEQQNAKVSWDGDDTLFRSNYAGEYGGALYTTGSTVHWDGDGTLFSNNSVDLDGGALCAWTSTVSWGGDGSLFHDNFADMNGGVVCATDSTVSWDGDGTVFSNNYAGAEGGGIAAYNSTVSWDGDGTLFSNNSADERGGAINGYENSTVSWDGDGTLFSSNYAGDGGAICVSLESTVSWDGDDTQFGSNNAAKDGGAIYAVDFRQFSWRGSPTFRSNVAGANGGALAFVDVRQENVPQPFIAATFIENRAGYGGGALYIMDCEIPLNFTDVTFQSNFASGAGGAVTAQFAGDESAPAAFSRCTFSRNRASNSGGAVEVLSGHQEFDSCHFEGNSADIGGAMILGGATVVRECSFLSNSVSSRGLAVAVVGSADISGSVFDGNELFCASGLLYREDTEKGGPNTRFEAVCFECPDWDECSGCIMTRGDVKPVCEVPLEHTTAEGPGTTLETLTIARGHWRATNQSERILACYNADACIGGKTGSDGYCSPGHKGPYCAVCETGYSSSLAYTCTRCSSSRRQGLKAAIAIGAIVAILAVAVFCRYVLSTEVEGRDTGCFHRRVLQAVPLQALKIIVVVWQILTQFAAAANVTYPGVYQDFVSAVSIINFDLGSLLAAGCLWSEVDFHSRLLVSTVWPLVAVGFLTMTYWIAMRRVGTTADRPDVVEMIRRKHQTVLLLLTFLVYSSVSSMVFQTFACETLDDGIEYLRADYRIHCTDAKHKAFEVYAGIMVMVYPIGIPLLYAVQLFQHRRVLADAGADKVAAQPIGGLWEPYRPERFYYEVVECGRRVMLTGVVVFIFPNDAAQVAITMLITFFFFGVFEVLSPYKSESDMWLSRGGHALVFLSMFYLLLLKVDVSGERDESQAAFAGLFVAGHVLMVLAIVVEVVGVCYASGKEGRWRRKAMVQDSSSVEAQRKIG
eukprot:g11818.t1